MSNDRAVSAYIGVGQPVWTTHNFAATMQGVEPGEWASQVGVLFKRARGRRSKREVARLAGFSDLTWSQLESGERRVARGVVLPVSPRDETLLAAAEAVGLDPALVMKAAGRTYVPTPAVEVSESDDTRYSLLGGIWTDLSEEDQEQVVRMAEWLRERDK